MEPCPISGSLILARLHNFIAQLEPHSMSELARDLSLIFGIANFQAGWNQLEQAWQGLAGLPRL